MEYVDPVIVENNEHSAYVIATGSPVQNHIALHITPELKYSRASYYGLGAYWCVVIVYDIEEDIFLFHDMEQRDKLRDLLIDVRRPHRRLLDAWPAYTYTVTVRPRLTEHEGFDPNYVREKMERLILAGCDKEFSSVLVKRT